VAASVFARIRDVARTIVIAWQSSLTLRVLGSTLALSLAVVTLLGATLVRQVTDGLLDAQRDQAVSEFAAGLADAQAQVEQASDVTPAALDNQLTDIVQDLATRGRGTYDVVLLQDAPEVPVQLRSRASERVSNADSVPLSLRDAVLEEPVVFSTYTEISSAGSDSGEPGLAVGGQLDVPTVSAPFGLYFLYPLTDQQEAVDLLRNGLATAAVLLVMLLGAIAWLVVRQVVDPVRVAARTAERFSGGRLQERMAVRGRDDLARLATSFNQMAASLQQQIRQLEELSRLQRQFVSDVSHELRTPLTTVRMAADVLHEARDSYDPETARAAELLQTQLDRFEDLLSDLLEISRFDAGAAVLEPEQVDVRDVVRRVVNASTPLATRLKTEVRLELPHEPCIAEVDRRRIERILRNLVDNAIEHGEGHPVLVRVAADNDAVAVAVRDHGVGLKPGESSLVFNRFWRADPARARTTGGTGLGLSIALEDARLHGGWLQAWGEPGDGSNFRLTLPRAAGAELRHSPLQLIPEDAEIATAMRGVGGPYQRIEVTPDAR
jgi:two-component system, OmpR family, sensor histidine kinase MtrB